MLAKCTPNDSVRIAPTGANTEIELRGPVKRLNDNCELYKCECVGSFLPWVYFSTVELSVLYRRRFEPMG